MSDDKTKSNFDGCNGPPIYYRYFRDIYGRMRAACAWEAGVHGPGGQPALNYAFAVVSPDDTPSRAHFKRLLHTRLKAIRKDVVDMRPFATYDGRKHGGNAVVEYLRGRGLGESGHMGPPELFLGIIAGVQEHIGTLTDMAPAPTPPPRMGRLNQKESKVLRYLLDRAHGHGQMDGTMHFTATETGAKVNGDLANLHVFWEIPWAEWDILAAQLNKRGEQYREIADDGPVDTTLSKLAVAVTDGTDSQGKAG